MRRRALGAKRGRAIACEIVAAFHARLQQWLIRCWIECCGSSDFTRTRAVGKISVEVDASCDEDGWCCVV